MLEGDLNMTEQQLADIAGEICRAAQAKGGVENGKLEILNTSRGGILTPKESVRQ
jgi:hypothetical protein